MTSKPSSTRRSRRGITVAAARRLLLKLPEIAEGRSYGMPSFLLQGRFFARFRDQDTVLVLQLATIAEREVLMELDPRAFFFTDHYRNYPAVLIRLADIPRSLFAGVVTEAWDQVSAVRSPRSRAGGATSLRRILTTLRRHYGKPQRPVSRDPFKLILWEQVAYLVPDAQRHRAFAALRRQVGLTPAAILAAPDTKLRAITRLGGPIAVQVRAARLRRSAELAVGRWDGDLRAALQLSIPKARKALAQFAMIGEPGADKILVVAKRARLLPLDSNGLRVLRRLGLTTDEKDYRTTYRRAQEVLAPALPKDSDALIAAYSLLRLHGKELCRRSAPQCDRCPLRKHCDFGSETGHRAQHAR